MPPQKGAPIEATDHAIQLDFIGVKALVFNCSRLPSAVPKESITGPHFTLGRGDYDPETKGIQVFCQVDYTSSEVPDFTFKIELVGQFRVDESAFPPEKVQDWADRASMYIILPYLREHVYGLSLRVGITPPLIMPMLLLPKYTMVAKQEAPAELVAN